MAGGGITVHRYHYHHSKRSEPELEHLQKFAVWHAEESKKAAASANVVMWGSLAVVIMLYLAFYFTMVAGHEHGGHGGEAAEETIEEAPAPAAAAPAAAPAAADAKPAEGGK